MSRLDDPPREWRYGVRWRGLWAAQNGTWERDGEHQARDWRERHMPGILDAWADTIGIFVNGRDVTNAWNRGEM